LTGIYIGKILNIPTVTTYHTLLDSYIGYVNSEDMGFNFSNLYTSWLYNQCPVITPSRSIKQILREKQVEMPIEIIPNAVNLKLVSRKSKTNGIPIILHVGRLCKEKRIDMVLRAFRNVLKKSDAILVITSNGPDEKRLLALAKDLGISNKVRFTGYLSLQDLNNVYSNSDLFVAASDTETQGLVVLEAMANGCAVIARNATGFKDVIFDGKNGLLFDNQKELEEKILMLLKNKAKRDRFVTEGFKTAKKFSPDRIVKKLEEYYENNLNQEKPPTVKRILCAGSLVSCFVVYKLVRGLDLPINSRLARISLDITMMFLLLGKIFNV
jgi:1,2-diacylglycerol 3-alpha-glucosyltransferase